MVHDASTASVLGAMGQVFTSTKSAEPLYTMPLIVSGPWPTFVRVPVWLAEVPTTFPKQALLDASEILDPNRAAVGYRNN